MIKSGLTLLLILIFLAVTNNYGLFEILTSEYTLWVGVAFSIVMLGLAVLVLGNPFKNKK